MAYVHWPAQLPQRVLRDGYGENMRDGRLRSRMETGPSKTRARTSKNDKTVECLIRVDYADLARFERFWTEEIKNGAALFIIPAQTRDGLELARANRTVLTTQDGRPILCCANWLVEFAGTPRTTPSGVMFSIAFSLNVKPLL